MPATPPKSSETPPAPLKLRRVAIDTYRENVAYLHRECSVVRAEGFQALAKIEAKTWGVELHQDSSGRFLILPPGVEPSTGWQIGKRQAVRLGKN